jgi:hypothetical protein
MRRRTASRASLALALLAGSVAWAGTGLVNLTTGAPAVDPGDGTGPSQFDFYPCPLPPAQGSNHNINASFINDAGQIVGNAKFQLASDYPADYCTNLSDPDNPPHINSHTGWFLYSPSGGMTFPFGVGGSSVDAQNALITNSQGISYTLSYGETYVFGLDNNGAVYAHGPFFVSPPGAPPGFYNVAFQNGRINADGTITTLADDLNPSSRVTLDGRSIVTATFGGVEVYRLNPKTGSFDGPTLVPLTLPNGSFGFAGGGGSPYGGSFYQGDFAVAPKWVNNRLQFLVAGRDSNGPHGYIYQVVNNAAVMVGDLGPGSLATAINEVGWATGYFQDGFGNIASNFIYRPQQKKFEIFNPPPPSQYTISWDPNAINGQPIPFGITNGGTVAIGLWDTSIDVNGFFNSNLTAVQRSPNGTYTSVGDGNGTVFPATYGPYDQWYLLPLQQNEQGQIVGASSRATHYLLDANFTNYNIGYESWLWTPAPQ